MDGIDLDRADIQCEFDCNLDQLFILVLYLVQCIQKSRSVTINFMVSVCLSAFLFVHMKQLSSHWTDFPEISKKFRNTVEKIQVSLKSDKNNGYFT